MLDIKTLEQSSIKAKDEFNHARSVAAVMKGEDVSALLTAFLHRILRKWALQ